MDRHRHRVELYNPYEPEPEQGPSTTEYKNEVRTGPLTQSTEQRAENSWLQHGLCFTLHGILVCVHFLILLVWITRAENKATFPLGKRSSIISTVIVQVPQIIGTLYLAGIIFVSQQLGVRRNVRTRQTLTATNDNMAAWSGLGAALVSLWRQKTLMASFVPSLLVVGYFVCITVLNITTPAIFSLQPFNQTRHAVIATTLGKPNISVNSLASSNPTSFWLDSTPVIPYLAHSDRASRIGLENGTLYDAVSKNSGKGTVALNATTFNVSCGYVDGASVTDSGGSGNWSIGTPYQGNTTAIPVLAPNTFKWLPLYLYGLKDPWRHALFYTSANITDSNGSNGAHILLNPPMQPGAHMEQSRKEVNSFSQATVYSIQIIGCTISLVNQSAVVDAESHLLQHVSPSGVKSTSQWSSWQPEVAPAPAPAPAPAVSASLQNKSVSLTNGGGGEGNSGGKNRIPTLALRQDSSPNPNNGRGSPPNTNPAPGNNDGGVGGTAPQAPGPEPALPNNGGGEPKGAPPSQNSDPNPAPPSDGGASGGGGVPQFASPQDTSPKPAPPSDGGSSPQPPPAPQNPNPNPVPPNNDGGATPQNSNPGSDDSGGVGGAAPQDPNPRPATPNSDGGGGAPPHNSNPSSALDGGGDRTPQFASPQDPNPNPAPPSSGGGSNPGDGNGGNEGGGGGGNSGQGTNTPGQGQGQGQSTTSSGPSGQGQSNPGQGGTPPQGGGGGQGDRQQNSNFGASGEPPSDNSNATPQNPPAAQGQDSAGGQQNPPGTGSPAPAGNDNGNTPGQSSGGDEAGQNGGDTSDGTQDTGGTGGTSGQDSGSQPAPAAPGDTSEQGFGGQNGGAESTGSAGGASSSGGRGGVTDQPISVPTVTSNDAEPPTTTSDTAAVVTVTSTTIKTTIVNATTTATATRTSVTPATLSYYDSSDVFLGVWWELFNQAVLSRFPSTDDCPGHPWQNPDVCNPFTVIEQFVLEDMGLYPILLDSPIRSSSKVATLHDFENSLASATAASYWAALHTIGGGIKDNDPSNAANNKYQVAAAVGNATMEYSYTVMQLTINLAPLLMGQVASILLFILIWYLIGRPVRSDSGIDTVGLLQIVWFMHARPELQRIIADVDSPSVEHLRKAGMMNTTLDGVGDETRPLAGGGE